MRLHDYPASGEALPESNAILIYLAEGTELLPDDPATRAQVMRWLFYEQGEIIPGIAGLRFRLQTGRLDPDSPAAEGRRAAGAAVLEVLDGHLREHDFLAGEAGFDLDDDYPAVRDWIARVEATPGHMNDLQPYPPNTRVGVGESIYG